MRAATRRRARRLRLGCGILGAPSELVGSFDAVLPVDLRSPGRPPTPETIAAALLELVDGTRHAPNQ